MCLKMELYLEKVAPPKPKRGHLGFWDFSIYYL